jgi:hypothetical protein
MQQAKLSEIVGNVERLTKGTRIEVKGNWQHGRMPIAFTSSKGSLDVVFRPADQAACSMIVSSKPSADFKGAVEVFIREEHLPYIAKWVADLMVLKEYHRIHSYLSKILYDHNNLCFVSSVIEIKQKKQ